MSHLSEVMAGLVTVRTLDIAPLREHHIRSAQVWHVFSKDFTVLPAHPCTRSFSTFAFPAIAGTHLPTPEGWKAELAWLAGYTYKYAFKTFPLFSMWLLSFFTRAT